VNIFIDTEFTNFEKGNRELISIGLVADDGREFYGESTEFRKESCTAFVNDVVLPKLGRFPGRAMLRAQLRKELLGWLAQYDDQQPVLCYDFIVDIVLFLDLVLYMPGRLVEKNIWPLIDEAAVEQYFMSAHVAGEPDEDHHALYDARANRYAYATSMKIRGDRF
jgi:hypothetical protein